MTYDGAMQTAFSKLSPEQQIAVCQYALSLINTPPAEVTEHRNHHSKRRLGMLSDRFNGISDDFHDPLPELEEYM